jgi:hypothetical protein
MSVSAKIRWLGMYEYIIFNLLMIRLIYNRSFVFKVDYKSLVIK